MQVRVVADQPWDVKADVLAVPIVGQPKFSGPLGELDKRTGGELTSLDTFGELKGKRYKSVLAGAGSSGQIKAGRILALLGGDADTLDREAVAEARRLRRAAARRSPGAVPRDLARARSPTPSRAAPRPPRSS